MRKLKVMVEIKSMFKVGVFHVHCNQNFYRINMKLKLCLLKNQRTKVYRMKKESNIDKYNNIGIQIMLNVYRMKRLPKNLYQCKYKFTKIYGKCSI